MRKQFCLFLLLLFVAELAVLWHFAMQDYDEVQDAVAVNEVIHTLQDDWRNLETHRNRTALDYVVLDGGGAVLFRTKPGLSESIHQAILHRDTILDVPGEGKVLIYNDAAGKQQAGRQAAVAGLGILIAVQTGACLVYYFYLERNVIRPFRQLKDFAGRIAEGNLDIPLKMDRFNLFGAFTESFDIMRAELKRARRAEAQANAAKKELVAELSHDIKTPIASIQAAAEVGAALAQRVGRDSGAALEQGRPMAAGIRENYLQIIRKAEQINTLVSNLFTAALEEMEQLSVTPIDMPSGELRELLESADYLHRAMIPDIPECLLYADRLRLQQVFDNLFANSYKYANTEIEIRLRTGDGCLAVEIVDQGGGIGEEELPLLKEKFKRGKNTEKIEGAGLGLYISDYFMRAMQGALVVENGGKGLKVTVMILLSGYRSGAETAR